MSAVVVAKAKQLIDAASVHAEAYLLVIELDSMRRGMEPTEDLHELLGVLTPEERAELYGAICDNAGMIAAYESKLGPIRGLLA